MTDDNSKEIQPPQKPPKRPLRDFFNREPVGPRDIAAEVRREMGVDQQEAENPIIQLNKELYEDFYNMIPGNNPEGKATLDYDYGDGPGEWFSFDVHRVKDEGNKKAIIIPQAIDAEQIRMHETSRGIFPENFIDSEGMLRILQIQYHLTQDGTAFKQISFLKFPKIREQIHEYTTIKADDENNNLNPFNEEFNAQDYELLKSYIAAREQGKLTVSQSN